MINKLKRIWIKYKTHQSVFEVINYAAFSTQTRPLGITQTAVNIITSHPTLTKYILPNILGISENSVEWRTEVTEYINGIQIIVPLAGFKLNLNYRFDTDDPIRKENIKAYIKKYKAFKIADKELAAKNDPKGFIDFSESELLNHILTNKYITPIDYHLYFSYEEPVHYLYWIVAITSSQVANTPEDVDKSTNIRFFIFDEKRAERVEMSSLDSEIKVINSISALYSAKDRKLIDIAILSESVDYETVEAQGDDVLDYVFKKVYNMCKISPLSISDLLNDAELSAKSNIRKLIAKNLLYADSNGNIVNSETGKVIGENLTKAVTWFKDPMNEADVNALNKKLK